MLFPCTTKHFNATQAKLIPLNPSLKLENELVSPSDTVKLSGSGLIPNLNSAYKFRFINLDNNLSFNIAIDKLSVSTNQIELNLNSEIPYGDYLIEFQFKNHYLKTAKQTLTETLKIRPEAENLELVAEVLLNSKNLSSLIKNSNGKELSLVLNSQDLNGEGRDPLDVENINSVIKLGLNEVQVYTLENGFKSILSQPKTFYFLPAEEFKPELLIKSKPFAVKLERYFTHEMIDLGSIVKQENTLNGVYYYLNSLEQTRYLMKFIEAVALKIETMKVIGDEAASIRNRGLNTFKLKKCKLADSIKTRFEFSQDIDLSAESSLSINGDLGLNNTGSDYLSLSCEVIKASGLETVTLDQFSYSKTDEFGFAIRE